MSEPIFYQHSSGHHVSVTPTSDGFALSAFDPKTGREVYGFERTVADAAGWADGLTLMFGKVEGSA